MWGEHTCDVVRWYARGGHAVDPAWTDLPDHLAVELQFLGALAAREAACRRDGETEQAAELAQLQSAFLQAHPVQWVPEVTRQISERAAWAYYRAFASLLERVLTGDIAHLESELLKR